MNKFNSIANIILFIAVAYLLFDKFSDKDNSHSQDSTESIASSNDIAETGVGNTLKIAYVNIDSLDSKYQYISDQQKMLEKEESKVKGGIEYRMKKAEKRASELQEQLPGFTQEQFDAAQRELQELEMSIQKYQSDQTTRLQDMQYKSQQHLKTQIDSFLIPFKDRYDMIFTLSTGGELLHANEAFNITDTLLIELNDSYAKSLEEK